MILSSEPTLLEPGASIHTYELWRMIFCAKEFQKIWTYLEGNYPCYAGGKTLTLKLAGLEVKLCQKKDGSGSIFLKVNPLKLLDATVHAAEIIPPERNRLKASWKELGKRLAELKLPHDPEDYRVTRVDCCVNLRAEWNGYVRETLRLAGKRLTPDAGERHPFYDKRLGRKENRSCNRDYYCVAVRRGTHVMYDKHKQGLRCHLLGVDRMPKCVLRTEWQLEGDGLTELRKRFHCKSEESVVTELAMHSGEVFREMLPNLYRRGVYVREDALMAAIDRCDCQEKSKRHMAEYVRLAKKYGEDKAAEMYMKRNGCGRKSFRRMRDRCEKMNLQPVPLRKNFREDVLEPPEACLLQLLKQHK